MWHIWRMQVLTGCKPRGDAMLSTTGAWLAVSHHSVGGHNILESQLKIVNN